MQSMRELLESWDCPSEVRPIVRLSRTLHRRAIQLRRTGQPYYVRQSAGMQADAADLLDYARGLKLRHTTNW